MFLALPFCITLCLTLLLVPISRNIGLTLRFLDLPDARKINDLPVVRIGGLAMFLSFFIGSLSIIFFGNIDLINIDLNYLLKLICFSLFFFLLGFTDDIYSLSPVIRLIIQFLLAFLILYTTIDISQIDIYNIGVSEKLFSIHPSFQLIFLMIWLVGITNAINWIDGLDGLASGCAGIIAFTFTLISLSNGQNEAALIGICLTATCLAFLRYNLISGNIFMGDGGSYYLGFTIAYLSIISTQLSNGGISFNIPLIVLSYPLLDMFFVIINRLRKNISIISPDSSHLHHRILKLGFNKKKTVFILYCLTLFTSIIALNYIN
tara:strand:- start:243 stop:1202 length:960 start_codon:yes stop_codon:yes gene_type:complete